MHYIIPIVAFFLIVLAPSMWVKFVKKQYNNERSDIAGTGGELAEHLIKRFQLGDTTVEQTTEGHDHYDPSTETVRLSPSNYNGKSLTAVAIATHEVGHAIQFHRQESVAQLHRRYSPLARSFKQAGIWILFLMPMIGILVRSPMALIAVAALSILLQLFGVLAHAFILPMEWDASFNKALPILEQGSYVKGDDMYAVERLLKAAAFTYVAAALIEIINLSRWLVLLRR